MQGAVVAEVVVVWVAFLVSHVEVGSVVVLMLEVGVMEMLMFSVVDHDLPQCGEAGQLHP